MIIPDFVWGDGKLTEDDVFSGLVNHGLFAEKVPPCFTSQGLSSAIDPMLANLLDESDDRKLRGIIDKHAHDFIRYESLRDINIPRRLGIPHPESHVVQSLAIRKHWVAIKTHCEVPSVQVSRIYVRHVGGGRIFEMNYKGSERYELEEDELKWQAGAQFIVEADISACFPSIYTHSIPWALHSREEAKKNRLLALPGNLLDKCTQNLRDSQTNGLLIGPHSSNIISEIILTRIDNELLNKGYKKLKRHIDDYEFYAATHIEAEKFLHDLGLALREYEMTLNEKKTKILPIPRPSTDNWVRELNRFAFSKREKTKFSIIRSFLDLALELAQAARTSAPLNYAIKMMPKRLNSRARRMYLQEAINLAISYPYLTPLLDRHVFTKYAHDRIEEKVAEFVNTLIRLGIIKLYPDAIAHSLYYALKYQSLITLTEAEFLEIIALDDCLTTVLLLEYAKAHKLKKIISAIKDRSASLKKEVAREQDRQWLLIYQTWSETELIGNGQAFLASLKKQQFEFIKTPRPIVNDTGIRSDGRES